MSLLHCPKTAAIDTAADVEKRTEAADHMAGAHVTTRHHDGPAVTAAMRKRRELSTGIQLPMEDCIQQVVVYFVARRMF